jgi:predicted nuclease with RNAse H fold
MRYCGVVPLGGEHLQLATLEEVRAPEPPIRLAAGFYEPGSPAQVAAALGAFEEVVVAIGAPLGEPVHGRPQRVCDELLLRRGVRSAPPSEAAVALRHGLAGLAQFAPDPDTEQAEGAVPEGAFAAAPLIETNADAVFCTLQGARLPAKRHPHGMRLRVRELLDDHVEDGGGGLWDRRIEEIDAAAAALCAHRYAVGHASWIGVAPEGVLVLPGTTIPEQFSTEGVLAPVERLPLPNA